MEITKKEFEELLNNETEFDSDYSKYLDENRGLEKKKIKKYGTWLRFDHPKKFNKIYNQFQGV